jgi:hypothetical protein
MGRSIACLNEQLKQKAGPHPFQPGAAHSGVGSLAVNSLCLAPTRPHVQTTVRWPGRPVDS